jgi:hypothetical protein
MSEVISDLPYHLQPIADNARNQIHDIRQLNPCGESGNRAKALE